MNNNANNRVNLNVNLPTITMDVFQQLLDTLHQMQMGIFGKLRSNLILVLQNENINLGDIFFYHSVMFCIFFL